MMLTIWQAVHELSRYRPRWLLAIAIGLLIGAGAALAAADDDDEACSRTAAAQFTACRAEVRDDFFVAQAICINVADEQARDECFRDARAARSEGESLCREQRDAREDLCEALGEDRYDADFDPADFDADFTRLTRPNPYFPLRIGNRWEYVAEDETVAVEVLDRTKRIEGVTCIVVNDRVTALGGAIEDTDDWFGQRKDGGVDYCGENVKDYETFAGDAPALPELVAIDGSFKTGRDGAKPGTQFLAAPAVGAVYRQEFSPGNAEDAARVLSTTYGFGSDPRLDAFVPRALAQRLCSRDCVVTGEFTPIEPDAFARKYYAKGIGLFLEVNPATGSVLRLVDCNFDARCAALSAR